MAEFELKNPPTDGISCLNFSPRHPEQLLVSSWDKTVRLYDVVDERLLLKISSAGAVLDVCFGKDDQTEGYSGGLDRQVKLIDLMTATDQSLGKHDDAVKSVVYSHAASVLFTGSWDKSVKMWDSRSSQTCVNTIKQNNKVFAMDVIKEKLVVASAGRMFYIYDVRNLEEPLQQRESSLKFMTRTVKCMPNGEGYVSTSIEGRVAVEFFDPSAAVQAKKYAFKCHRQNEVGVDKVYPVNAIAFHPKFGTFASGGGDGVVNIWDGFNKKRIKQYPKYPTSIAALSFNSTGQTLAIASSYTFEEGEKDHPADTIVIKPIQDADVKPKHLA